jgi:hypothetical protein
MFMDCHHVQQVCPFFATKFSLHERSRDSPFNIIFLLVAVFPPLVILPLPGVFNIIPTINA